MRRLILIALLALTPLIVLASGFKSPHRFPKNAPLRWTTDQTWRMREQVIYYTEPGTGWEPEERYTLDYDSQNPQKITNVWNYYWDWFVGAWDLNYKVTHNYIANTDYISHSQISTVYSGIEYPYGRTFVTYDAQMRLESIAMEMWDWDIDDWAPWSRVSFEYRSDLDYTVHNWFMGFEAGVPEWRKIEFEWDGLGRIIQETEYASMDSINWNLDNRLTRTYHPNDSSNGVSFITAITKQLPLSYYFDADFDYFGMVETEQQDFWVPDFAVRDWVPAYRDSYSYDTQDNLQQILTEAWFGDTWEPYDLKSYSYDANFNLTQKTESIYGFDMTWEDSKKTEYEWDALTSNTDNHIAPASFFAVRAYPAPFQHNLTIEVRSKDPQPVKIGIYNLKGQLVREFSCSPNQGLVWDGMTASNHRAAAGIYFIKATQGKHSQTSKVLRMK